MSKRSTSVGESEKGVAVDDPEDARIVTLTEPWTEVVPADAVTVKVKEPGAPLEVKVTDAPVVALSLPRLWLV